MLEVHIWRQAGGWSASDLLLSDFNNHLEISIAVEDFNMMPKIIKMKINIKIKSIIIRNVGITIISVINDEDRCLPACFIHSANSSFLCIKSIASSEHR